MGWIFIAICKAIRTYILSFPPLSSPPHMETWMTSQCGMAAREGKSLGYSGLTRRRAGYADFSKSLQQHWGMALMQSKLPRLYGFHSIVMVSLDRLRCRQVYYHWNQSAKSVMDPRPVNQKCVCVWHELQIQKSIPSYFILWDEGLILFCKSDSCQWAEEKTTGQISTVTGLRLSLGMSELVNCVCLLWWTGPGCIFA